MSSQVIREKIIKLRDVLSHHNHLYYVLDQPEISDMEFDYLMKKLADLEKKHPEFSDPLSPTVRVGGDVLKGFNTIEHSQPMLSLSNTYSSSDLEDFDHRIKKKIKVNKIQYSCELKYDGVAISLIYKNGLLNQALTRGDGFFGDDVTENIKTIKSIPLKLFGDFPDLLEMRGEVFIHKKQFEKINQNRASKKTFLTTKYEQDLLREENDEVRQKIEKKYIADCRKLDQYANPRNFASGSLKLLDSKKVAKRHLDCILYAVYSSNLLFDNHIDNLLEAKKWGFKIPSVFKLANNMENVIHFITEFENKRDSLPFEIDGVVIKVNNLVHQKLLGNTAKSPRWAISYKFKALQASTILEDVKYQVGRTGAITPVACLKPVFLAGSVIKRASLHNEAFINNLDLKIQDVVIIEKGGDVIPKVVAVDIKKRSLFSKKIEFTSFCPSCGFKLIKPQGEANYYCYNFDHCLPQKITQVEHFISRDAMNINTLGSKTICLLFEKHIIKDIADLYILQLDQLIGLKGFGGASKSFKKANNILNAIEKSKLMPFHKLLYALGIRHIGKTVAKKLVFHFNSINALMLASRDDLLLVDEVGDKIADSLISYFNKDKNQIIIDRLVNYGLIFESLETENVSNKLNNSSFVISGTFTDSRDYLKNIIESNGGKNVSALSNKTSYLIAGENAGSKKIEKALSLKIPIISELDFKKMLE